MIKTVLTTTPSSPDEPSAPEPSGRSRAGSDDDGSDQSAPEPEPPSLILAIEGEIPGDLDAPFLRDAISRALEHLNLIRGNLAVRVLDDEEMTRLHEQFAGVCGTTDVLTFDHRGPEEIMSNESGLIEADVAVCHDVARRESSGRGHDITRELILYVVHGILHCLGYDDQDEESYEEMHQREDEILEAIGIGRTFGRE